jgi:hypothetical protein
MSDSSCSNCDKKCEYRDFSYDCYKRAIDEVRKCLTNEDYNNIKVTKEKLEKAYEKEYTEELKIGYEQLKNIIDLYEGK